MSSDKNLSVVVSYSHRDRPWLERVQVHLKPLAREGRLELWDDTRIKTGERWRKEIKAALAQADVAVLLISADFFASDFVANNELPPLLEAARNERGLVIAGVHINYSRFDRDKVLSEYQTVNTPDRPIKGLPEDQQEKVFDDLARRIEELVPARSAAMEIPLEYLKWLEARYAGIELLGQDIQQGLAIKLSHVYVPALTQPAPVALDAEQEMQKRVEEILEVMAPSDLDAEQVLLREVEEKRSRLLLHRIDQASLYVPAPAGAGKSTFCRWAVLQSIPTASTDHPVPAPEEYWERSPEALRTRLPLLIPLRDFGKDMDCGRGRPWHRNDLEQALAAWVDRSGLPGLDGAMFKAHLATGSAFLLLDGLDEVAISETRGGTDCLPARVAAERSGRRSARLGGSRRSHPADQPPIRSGRSRPSAPPPAPRAARAAPGALAGAVRQPLVPHSEERAVGRGAARGYARS